MRRTLALSLLSGLLLALAQPPYGLGPLAIVALVPWLVAADARAARGTGWRWDAAAGFALGVGQFGGMLYWIGALPLEEMAYPAVRLPALLALVLYLSVYTTAFALLRRVARAHAGAPEWLATPFAWTACEWWRGSFALGFPWGSFGYALAEKPAMIQGAAWVGVAGLSWWLALVNVAAAAMLRPGEPGRRHAARGALFLALLWAPILGGIARLRQPLAPYDTLRVGLVQPNFARSTKWLADLREKNLEILESLTSDAAARGAEFIVWPETAATSYLRYDPPYAGRVRELVDRTGTTLFAGCLDADPPGRDPRNIYNAAVLMQPGRGITATYRKVHLVPFGEEIPYQRQVPWLAAINLGEADFTPGDSALVMDGTDVRAGPLVCFEAIFPSMARHLARHAADLLVNITNDSWFGRSAAPYQHAAMAVVRAVETGRPVARAANTGVSLLADSRGRVLARSDIFTREVLVAEVPLTNDTTPYTRWGGLLDAVHPVAGGVLLAWGLVRQRRAGPRKHLADRVS